MKELVQDFLNQKINRLPISYMQNSVQDWFKDIRNIYNWQMKEYITELTNIQSKLVKYDRILSYKKQKKISQNFRQSQQMIEMGLDNKSADEQDEEALQLQESDDTF